MLPEIYAYIYIKDGVSLLDSLNIKSRNFLFLLGPVCPRQR